METASAWRQESWRHLKVERGMTGCFQGAQGEQKRHLGAPAGVQPDSAGLLQEHGASVLQQDDLNSRSDRNELGGGCTSRASGKVRGTARLRWAVLLWTWMDKHVL